MSCPLQTERRFTASSLSPLFFRPSLDIRLQSILTSCVITSLTSIRFRVIAGMLFRNMRIALSIPRTKGRKSYQI